MKLGRICFQANIGDGESDHFACAGVQCWLASQ